LKPPGTIPFLIKDLGWTEAKYLKPGDLGLLKDGKYLQIIDITQKHLEAKVNVYNFEVENVHSYMVGEDGVVVHNYFETALDIISFGISVNDLKNAIQSGDKKEIVVSSIAVAVDGLSIFTPTPGGVGLIRKGIQEGAEKLAKEGGEKLLKEGVEQAVKEGDEAVDAANELH
jgi:hypothetical protein